MKFSDLARALEEGKRIKKKNWPEGYYIYLDDIFINQDGDRYITCGFRTIDGWDICEEENKFDDRFKGE